MGVSPSEPCRLLSLGGIVLGGALPWLEAVVVIPGIIAGLPVILVVLAGVTGNLITVGLAAWFGERVRAWWIERRRGRRAVARHQEGPAAGKRARRQARVDRIMARWGLPALALLGPIGLGTQVSAIVGVGSGARAGVTFAWIGGGTVAWSIVDAVAAVTDLSIAGIGG